MNAKNLLQNRLRGWLPKEATLPSKTVEAQRKEATNWQGEASQTAAVANAVMVGSFLGLHLLADSYTRSAEVSAVFWAVFVPTVIVVNVWIYRHCKRQARLAEV